MNNLGLVERLILILGVANRHATSSKRKRYEELPWYTGDHVFFALVRNGAPKVRASIFDLIAVSFPSLSPSQFRSGHLPSH